MEESVKTATHLGDYQTTNTTNILSEKYLKESFLGAIH